MKKKIIAITLAVSAMMSTVAFAENINANYTDNVLSFEHRLPFSSNTRAMTKTASFATAICISLRTAISVPIYLKSIRG